MKYSVAIVDDDPNSRDNLKRLVEAHSDMECVGGARSVEDGLDLVQRVAPDIVLLDLDLPEGARAGFELIDALSPPRPEFIIVSQHGDQPEQALGRRVAHYLMKPVKVEKLSEALSFARDRIPVDYLSFPGAGRTRLSLPLKNLVGGEADGDRTKLKLSDGTTVIAHLRLGVLLRRLPERSYLKTHKSHFFYPGHPVEYEVVDEFALIKAGKHKVWVSADKRKMVEKRLRIR